jgi:hypothetical protein
MSKVYLSVAVIFLFSCNGKKENKKVVTDSAAVVAVAEKPKALTPTCFLEDLLSIKSESELKTKFGADHISVDTIWGEQGAYVLGSFIDEHTKNEVQIMWKDFPKCTGVSEIIIQSYSSPLKEEAFANEWKSKTGIKLGMTTSELEKINGKPFVIFRFNESVLGNIEGWNNGNINGRKIQIDLSAAGKMNKLSQKELNEIFNNYNIPSQNKVIRKVQPWVTKITILK